MRCPNKPRDIEPSQICSLFAAILFGALVAGCSSQGGAGGDGTTAGSGGASTGDGASGTGGGSGTGGRGGSDGSGATGGRTGSGGNTAGGGVAGTSAGGSAGGIAGVGGLAGTAGSQGSGGSASGDGGVKDAGRDGTSIGYQPCQFNPCKILPLGDSITFGVNDEGNGGYRGPLFAAAVAAGQKITFSGSLSNGPTLISGQSFPQKNEGHSGWGISEVTPFSGGNAGIATVIPNPAFSSSSGGTPEIILLHIGTNDSGTFSATQMQSDLNGLLDKLATDAPNALVVLAQIIPLGYDPGNAVIRAYNQALPGIVQQRAAAGKHIMLVDMNTGFSVATMFGSDNIHPNTAGYQFMAAHWYAAIGSLLPR